MLQMRERLLAIACFQTGKPIVAHQVHEHLAQARLIIDDEAVWCCVGVFWH